MERFLNKKYKMERHENLDAILFEMGKKNTEKYFKSKVKLQILIRWGVNAMMRKISRSLTTVLQLVKKGENRYSLNTSILIFSISQKFVIGEETDITTADGRKVKDSFTIEDNKLIEVQKGEKTLLVVREFFDTELIVTTSCGDVVSKTWCKMIE